VGHPYIASLWLGFLALKRSRLNGVLRRSLALFCLLPSYFQASENRLTKGSKVPFVILCAHSHVWMGSMYTRHFVLYIMDPVQIIANIHIGLIFSVRKHNQYCSLRIKPNGLWRYKDSIAYFFFDAIATCLPAFFSKVESLRADLPVHQLS